MLSYSFDLLIVTGYNYYWFFFFIRLKKLIKTLILFFCNTSYFFNFLPNGEYWNYFNAAAFSSKSLCSKTSLSVENSYLLKFPDNKAEYWAVCLSKFYWALSCLILLLITLTNDAICWSSVSLGIFMTKCGAFGLIVLDTLTKNWYKNKWNVEFSSSWKQFSNNGT